MALRQGSRARYQRHCHFLCPITYDLYHWVSSGFPAHVFVIVSTICLREVLLPSLSLVVLFVPVRPLNHAAEALDYGRLLWIPLAFWFIFWIVLVSLIYRSFVRNGEYSQISVTLKPGLPIEHLALFLLWFLRHVVPQRWWQRGDSLRDYAGRWTKYCM